MPHHPARLQAQLRVVRSAAVAALALAAGAGCPGNLDTQFLKAADMGGGLPDAGNDASVPHCDDAPMILKTRCGTGCHTPDSDIGADLDLLTDGVADRLLGRASTGTKGAACAAGSIYLVPSHSPATGLFVDKLTTPTCGEPMPPLPIPAASLQCLLDWAASITAP